MGLEHRSVHGCFNAPVPWSSLVDVHARIRFRLVGAFLFNNPTTGCGEESASERLNARPTMQANDGLWADRRQVLVIDRPA